MTTRVCNPRRAGRVRSPLIAVALLLLWSPTQAGAAPGTATDPDDTNLSLDIRTVSHDNDASTITYTVDTYEPFPDDRVDFKWLIDKNGDGAFDLIVTTEYEDGSLGAGVDDARERAVGKASVSRPAANAVRVSFPAGVLQGSTSYGYQVSAISDLNGNGETDPGEEDLAPNTGWYQHSLAAVTTSPPTTVTTSAPRTTPGAFDGRLGTGTLLAHDVLAGRRSVEPGGPVETPGGPFVNSGIGRFGRGGDRVPHPGGAGGGWGRDRAAGPHRAGP